MRELLQEWNPQENRTFREMEGENSDMADLARAWRVGASAMKLRGSFHISCSCQKLPIGYSATSIPFLDSLQTS